MTTHTPTPWAVELETDDEEIRAIIRDSTGEFVAELRHNIEAYHTLDAVIEGYTQMKTAAAHIVHCVNTHDEREALVRQLVGALKMAYACMHEECRDSRYDNAKDKCSAALDAATKEGVTA